MSEHKYKDAYKKGYEKGKQEAFTGYCMECYDELSHYEQAKLMVEWGADIPKSCEAKCLDCLLTEKVVIKDNITNGDVIKAVFPNGKVYNEEESCITVKVGDNDYVDFYEDWWNALYKAGSGDKE